MEFKVKPVTYIRHPRKTPGRDFWGSDFTEIELAENIPAEVFEKIEEFFHLEIIYFFDKAKPEDVVYSERPRGNPAYPVVGIFVYRRSDRPNPVGVTFVELVEHSGRKIIVKNLDAIDGTPILDIKPVFREFLPKGEIRQPSWVSDLMKDYWK